MAVNASLVAKLASTATNKEDRGKMLKLIGKIVGGILAFIVLIVVAFVFFLSGLLSFISDNMLRDNWNLIRNNVIGVFEGIDRSAAQDIKKQVYEFMPDFSVNLSKAAISAKYNGNSLLMYDTSDYQKARDTMKIAAESIRNCTSEETFAAVCEDLGIPDEYSYNDISLDTVFMEDTELAKISEYGENVLSLLSDAAAYSLGSYDYEYEEYTTDSGKSATRQTLTVKENGHTQIVEYNAVGGVEIYIPQLLAYYQTRLENDTLLNDTAGEDLDKALEDGLAEDIGNAENEEELNNAVKKSNPTSILNFLEIADMANILSSAVAEGKIGVDTTEVSTPNLDKLTIRLEAPDMSEWLELFEIGSEQTDTIQEFQTTIEESLNNVGVSEEKFYLNLDDFFQSALFVYFEGFFNLPVDRDRLFENGIFSKYGDYSEIHRTGGTCKLFESGTTLKLIDDGSDTEVMIDLLPSVGTDCFDDVVIYDVWKAEEHPTMANANELFNCDSITIAYYIDLEKFEKIYGFPFPEADPETPFEESTITMLVEYSCLSECYYDEVYRGDSILNDIKNGAFSIGKAHNGIIKDSDRNREVNDYHHIFSEISPHCSIKIDFVDGWVELNEKAGQDTYTGMSGRSYRNYNVSPLLWFKGFRTEVDDDALAGLIAAN